MWYFYKREGGSTKRFGVMSAEDKRQVRLKAVSKMLGEIGGFLRQEPKPVKFGWFTRFLFWIARAVGFFRG